MATRRWLKDAVEGAGGVSTVSHASGLSIPYLYKLIAGNRALTTRVVSSLRPVLGISDNTWFDAMVKESTPAASQPSEEA